MRRSAAVVVAFAATLGTALSLLPAASSSAHETDPALRTPAAEELAEPTEPVAKSDAELALESLETAEDALAGTVSRSGDVPEATIALRDLVVALEHLPAGKRRRAEALLARPSDGVRDPQAPVGQGGYRVPSRRICSANICVHWVSRTADAATVRQAKQTLKVMNRVWRHHIKKMGYRKPVADGRRGGNKKFDVYLKNIGAQNLYGYCASEPIPNSRFPSIASGYCVLDNDYKETLFRGRPINNLRVTAAHEFMHAIQFGYDYLEDKWLMESTATWMEERFASDVNDNRHYLPAGQTQRPDIPLDTFYTLGGQHYGNWPFWEYLGQRYGNRIVRQVWQQAAAYKGAPDRYSTQALTRVLRKKGGFPKVFAAYAAGNTVVARTYREGRYWKRGAPFTKSWTLNRKRRSAAATTRIDHLASANFAVRPAPALKAKKWKLRIRVVGPTTKSSPAAHAIIKLRNGKLRQRPIKLNRKGNGQIVVPFSRRKVKSVNITLANASTRSNCWTTSPSSPVQFSCLGTSKDDPRRFKLRVTLRT